MRVLKRTFNCVFWLHYLVCELQNNIISIGALTVNCCYYIVLSTWLLMRFSRYWLLFNRLVFHTWALLPWFFKHLRDSHHSYFVSLFVLESPVIWYPTFVSRVHLCPRHNNSVCTVLNGFCYPLMSATSLQWCFRLINSLYFTTVWTLCRLLWNTTVTYVTHSLTLHWLPSEPLTPTYFFCRLVFHSLYFIHSGIAGCWGTHTWSTSLIPYPSIGCWAITFHRLLRD